jgi:ankyrin repeat protein
MKYESEPEVRFKVDGQSIKDWGDRRGAWIEFNTAVSILYSFTSKKFTFPNLDGPFSKDLHTFIHLHIRDYKRSSPKPKLKYYDFIQILSGKQKLKDPLQVIGILQFLLVYSTVKPESEINFYIGVDPWFYIEGVFKNTVLQQIKVIGKLLYKLESLNLESFCVEIEEYSSFFKITEKELLILLSRINENIENEFQKIFKNHSKDISVKETSFALKNNLNKMQNLIGNNKIDINAPDKDGETAIFSAARKGTVESVKYLVASGANVNYKNKLNRTPLLIAAWNDSVDIVKYLYRIGSDVTIVDNFGMNALIASTWIDSIEVVKYLIETGLDINYVDENNQSVLSTAVWRKSVRVIEYLLGVGADIDSIDNDGETALFGAVWNNSIEIVKSLIEAGANINHSDNIGRTVLFAAIISDLPEITKYLVEAGSDINHIDNDGKKALSYAHGKKLKEAIRLL